MTMKHSRELRMIETARKREASVSANIVCLAQSGGMHLKGKSGGISVPKS